MVHRRKTKAFDDNGAGVISVRGWQYSADEDGNPIKPATGDRIMRVKKSASPPWRECPATPDDSRPRVEEELARLTKDERRAWELQQVGEDVEMVRLEEVAVGEEVAMNRRGFTVIEGTKRTIERNGRSVVVYDFEGKEYSVRGLSYAVIAERMGATLRQVKRWLGEARRKLKGDKCESAQSQYVRKSKP